MTDNEAKNFAKDPKRIDLENRAIKALQRSKWLLMEGMTDEEWRQVGEQGCEELSADCFLEQYGNDDEACHWFWTLPIDEQEELMDRAFNRRKR